MMSNDPIRGTAEGVPDDMPPISRRSALGLMRSSLLLGVVGLAASASQCQPMEAPAAENDPMLDLLTRYRVRLDHFDTIRGLDDVTRDTLMDETWLPLWKEITDSPPPVTTHAGAIAAIREAIAEIDGPCFQTSVLTAALTFLNGRAGR